ncbi:MAG: tetratricopeptide repeat protein [Pseudomonadota bacterium]
MLTSLLAVLLATQAVGESDQRDGAAQAGSTPDIASEAITAGRGDDVIPSLERARAKHVNDPAVLINLGVAYAHRGDDAKARDLFKAALKSPTVLDLETANGDAVSSRKLARKALSMLNRGELLMASVEK